ncbi:LysR family transcriptional regulator [Sporomusa malonica]|uniref:DNA-binding transcriptional regulator, LysR family n=1 Tax=Sporomusa malonica TaxID=112901 RepID=A0A1W2BCD5_9FIRM|nr:LysR family transcriptional regulator [Sporomusa malonica]SMC70625.1 DNA-binding transcriptional regulator, LysR family [Sporomusa malonica]
MDERDWLIFHILYEKRNITKTGQALFISQPALTTRLRQIEDELGAKLIYRSGKGIHFTSQGEYLAKCSKEMLTRIQEIKDRITNMHEGVRGTLRIAATHYMTKYKLPRLLKLFKTLYPQMEFKVNTVWSKEVLNLVNTQEVHIGFMRGEYPWPDEKKLLFEENMCIASTEPISIQDLPNLPRISYRTDESVQLLIDNWWRENFTVPPFISMAVDRLDTCKDMVENGHGYAIMGSGILHKSDDVYKTVILDKNNTPIIRRAWMIYQKDALSINAVKAFVDFSDTIDYLDF